MRGAGLVVAALAVLLAAASPAAAVQPPQVVIGAPPPDGPPGPETPMKQDKGCLTAGLLPHSDVSQPPPPETALNLPRARALSRGDGVTVAVVDTGVAPDARLPNLVGGGDYVQAGGNGLSDCDAHGTLVAGIIAAAADPGDQFLGVAPAARILSIRYHSAAFSPEHPAQFDPNEETNREVRNLARAITHAANLGAGVITVALPVCLAADAGVDQSMLSAAIGYAVHVRGALIVAGAGSTGSPNCEQNPGITPGNPRDLMDWTGVKTISTPGWFSPDVLTVGFTTAAGAQMSGSLMGPWISVAGPGTGIESLGPGGSTLVNGIGAPGKLEAVGGASFAAAYVSGAAALLRSRFPAESPAQISARLEAGAHQPARGVDDSVGAGMIDPVAALGYSTAPKPPSQLYRAATLRVPPPRPVDHRPIIVATVVMLGVVVLGVGVVGVDGMLRRRR
ncbi:type VII secretion-associated serine protease mycosin [Nocardia vaccinii]|uniref:type VII secretion-associated serine protease mycosin n=1 Tax=Nocardia vaccinii TaxID=1822 RepID=UPI0008299F13|nr:type VII secretion-associated serine protease mycosin [Nocardia vaccinii]